MSDWILVRHASTAWSGRRYCGTGDPPLDADGRTAALALAAGLAATLSPTMRLISSPRLRALETAEAIRSAAGIATIEIDDRWREVDFGRAEGLTFEELAVVEPSLAARLADGDTEIDWPGGESSRSLTARVREALASLAAPSVVVSHAGPMRIAIGETLGIAPRDVELAPPGAVVRLPAAHDRAPASSRATLPR